MINLNNNYKKFMVKYKTNIYNNCSINEKINEDINTNKNNKSDFIIVKCPHCKDYIYIKYCDFNCKIFRHGVYIKNLDQINPHEKKYICDEIFEKKKIYGCGKPFKLIYSNDNYIAIICDYI
jgi:hypothetical protein